MVKHTYELTTQECNDLKDKLKVFHASLENFPVTEKDRQQHKDYMADVNNLITYFSNVPDYPAKSKIRFEGLTKYHTSIINMANEYVTSQTAKMDKLVINRNNTIK